MLWLLRKHRSAHDMPPHASSNGRSIVFDEAETSAFVEWQSPGYVQAVVDGTFLKRLPSVEAMYAIIDTQRWTEELRASMTEQLGSRGAMASFATLTLRPGYVSDRTTTDEIMDGDAVLNRLFQIAENGFLPADPWLRASSKRLAATPQGHDPNFVHDHNGNDYITAGPPDVSNAISSDGLPGLFAFRVEPWRSLAQMKMFHVSLPVRLLR